MNIKEKKIINDLMDYGRSNDIYDYIQNTRLENLSHEFVTHIELKAFREKRFSSYIELWFRVVEYFFDRTDTKLTAVESYLSSLLYSITPQNIASGTALLPVAIANPGFINIVYSSGDEKLTTLFSKCLPIPRPAVLKGAAPEMILRQADASKDAIRNVIQKNSGNLPFVEAAVTKMQRIVRAKKRKKETLNRLFKSSRYDDVRTPEDGKQLIADANQPYRPQCEKIAGLDDRIMEAAKRVTLFSTVKHFTDPSALESIFNDGLFGRRTLLEFYIPFKEASLKKCDIENGDANVVCLGANQIDPLAMHGIELTFDVKKIAKNNPCAFYKQKDLGYHLKAIRTIEIGDLKVHFSHTESYRNVPNGYASLVLFYNERRSEPIAFSSVKKDILIADNLNDMHRILTLNFFRFIDKLMDSSYEKDTYTRDRIYDALNGLDDEALVDALQQIGVNLTDTMEFNFYGAYKIDFSALLTIKKDRPFYFLNLPEFVEELNVGNIGKLNEVMIKLPEIFNSYRFIDFLLSKINNESVMIALQEQRKKCSLPDWMEEPNQDAYRPG
jgi:hypothetical protein